MCVGGVLFCYFQINMGVMAHGSSLAAGGLNVSPPFLLAGLWTSGDDGSSGANPGHFQASLVWVWSFPCATEQQCSPHSKAQTAFKLQWGATGYRRTTGKRTGVSWCVSLSVGVCMCGCVLQAKIYISYDVKQFEQ